MSTNNLIIRIGRTILGLFIFSFGLYLTIICNIGLAPWDVLVTGISNHTPFSYGNILTVLSLLIILFNLYLHEKIGLGTLLDALLVGNFVDLLSYFQLIPFKFSLIWSIVVFIVGLFFMGYGQFFYMSSAIGCGPRDTLLIGLGKRVSKIPIGFVSVGLSCLVLFIGMLLGGSVGIGTILATVGMGTIMQFVFNLLHFEPRDIKHDSIITTFHHLMSKINN